jgi:DNA-binding CsgD family transcriptional regulator
VELIGRDEDIARIWSFVEQASSGGGALLVAGDAGVGKTVLLEEVASRAQGVGTRVLRAAGAQFEADLSFAGLHQVVYPLFAELGGLPGPHASALQVAVGLSEGDAHDPLVVGHATLSLLLATAAHQALLLVVDDLPWLDRPSAVVLGFVARRLRGGRVGFLAAARSEEPSFFERGDIPTYDLAPLGEEAAEQLLLTRFPALAARVRQRLRDEAQGNPLALLELPAALIGTQRRAGTALPPVLPLSGRLEDLFAARVRHLPDATRQLLLLAALDGTGDVAAARHAVGSRWLEDIPAAERAGLVRLDAGQFNFRHPLTRSAVVSISSSEERRHSHQVLAKQLIGQPERRAWHLAEAAVAPDEEVAALLELAAHRTLDRGDAVGAVAALTRAADLSPTGYERGRRLAQAAYLGANVAGTLRDVPRLLEEARVADPERPESLATTVAAAYYLLNGEGDLDTAHRLLAGAIEMLAGHLDPDDGTLVEALHTLLRLCYFGGRPELWEPLDRALRKLPHVPDDLVLLRATIGDPVRTALPALDSLDSAIAALGREADPVRIVRIAIAAWCLDRIAGCREALTRVVEDGRRGGAVTAGFEALILLADHAYLTGEWHEVRSLSAEALQLCDTNNYGLSAWLTLWLQGLVAAARGDSDQARDLADQMTRWAGPRQIVTLHTYASHLRTLAAQADGDFAEAHRHAASITEPGTFASYVPLALRTLLDLTETAVRSGRHAEAAAHVNAARDAQLGALSSRLAMVVAGAAGMASTGDDFAPFEEALAVPGGARWPFDLARIQLAYGERLRRAKATTKAREQLAAALEIFDRLGAEPWAARARSEMRATGLSVGPSDPAGVAALTPQQREIALLAAAGLTNKQIGERLFLSPRTVGTHLYQVVPKLGIASRAALRDALRNESIDQI